MAAPAFPDSYLSQIFTQLRTISGLPVLMIAARLGTEPAVIDALERGDVSALPDRPETVRIVAAYGRMCGVDLASAFQRIDALRSGQAFAPAAGPAFTPPPSQVAPASTPPPATWTATGQNSQAGYGVAHAVAPYAGPEFGVHPGPPPGLAMLPPGAEHMGWIPPASAPQQPPPFDTPRHPPLAAQSFATQSFAIQAATQPLHRTGQGHPGPSHIDRGHAGPPPGDHMQSPHPRDGRDQLVQQHQPTTYQQMGARHGSQPAGAGPVAPVPDGMATLPPINPLQPPETAMSSRTAARDTRSAPAVASPAAVVGRLRQHPARIALKYVTAPMCLVAGLWYTIQHPTQVHAALGHLPEPLPRIAQAGMDIVLVSTAPTRDGLRMISSRDPRARKADKLKIRRAASEK